MYMFVQLDWLLLLFISTPGPDLRGQRPYYKKIVRKICVAHNFISALFKKYITVLCLPVNVSIFFYYYFCHIVNVYLLPNIKSEVRTNGTQ